MAGQNVHEFTDANFENEVLKSPQPVLVDFWAEWCMPCRMLGPAIDALADEFAGKAKIGKVNTDNSQATSIKFNIMAIPTVIIFKNGQPVKRFQGVQSKENLASAINAAIG